MKKTFKINLIFVSALLSLFTPSISFAQLSLVGTSYLGGLITEAIPCTCDMYGAVVTVDDYVTGESITLLFDFEESILYREYSLMAENYSIASYEEGEGICKQRTPAGVCAPVYYTEYIFNAEPGVGTSF